MAERASLVIVGAGVVGCTVAWHLARRGWTDIVVLEQGPFPATGGSTSHAPGMVFQTSSSKALTGFARETVTHLSAIDFEGEPCWHGVGGLEVATTEARWTDLHRKLGWAKSWGVPGAALLTPEEAQAMLPFLDPGAILGAFWSPTDGVARPVRAIEAMIRACGAAVELRARTPVVGIDVAGGRVTGVRTPDGVIATDRMLACGGIWGPTIGKMAGVPIPLVPVEHQFLWTETMPEFAGGEREIAYPILRHQDRDLYMRHRRDHFAVGSYQHEPVLVESADIRSHGAPDDTPATNPFRPETFAPAWDEAVRLLPFLAKARPATALNGMFSFTPDANPLIGESQYVRGFWSAMAIWITHSAGAARATAELLDCGRTSTDLHECDLNRFEPHQISPAYVRERGAQQYREVYDVIHPLQPMEQPRPLRVSPFVEQQRALGAVFFEGRGWEQPRWYEANRRLLDRYPVAERNDWTGRFWSPIAGAEHMALRDGVALVDMSPLPKLDVTGPGAAAFLESVVSNRVDRAVGAVTYGLLLDERGGIRSDVTVARLAEDRFQVGANGPLDLVWLHKHLPSGAGVQVRDIGGALCCVGLWGPKARTVVQRTSDDDWSDPGFPYFSARQRWVGEVPVIALRVSYVGEQGWELYCSPEYGARLWSLLWQAGDDEGIVAVGRAAFDSLRLEKGYRLWGTDMDTERTPFEAGLGFAVKPNKGAFVGSDAVREMAAKKPAVLLRCLALDDPTTVLMGKEPILAGGEPVGYVTSAGFGYSVGASIAFGYLPAALAEVGSRLEVDAFGRPVAATVVDDPLYDPAGLRLRG